MDDKRKKERHHIQAAKEWLDGAERSLEGQDDVRGDLRVMLAKAELAHVGAGKHVSLLRRLGTYLLPVALAGAIAAGIVYGLNHGESVSRTEPAAATAKDAAERKVRTDQSAQPQEELPDESAADRPAQPALAETAQKDESQGGEASPPGSSPSKSSVETTSKPMDLQPSKRAEPPDAETQKLMQTAGKALRK